jgi:hypothetical protein
MTIPLRSTCSGSARIDSELRYQRENGEKAADEMDAERGASVTADSNEGSE